MTDIDITSATMDALQESPTPRAPRTAAGRDAVKMRGLFGGETEERATEWVKRIEAEAAEPAPLDADLHVAKQLLIEIAGAAEYLFQSRQPGPLEESLKRVRAFLSGPARLAAGDKGSE